MKRVSVVGPLAAALLLAACGNSPPRLEPIADVEGKVDAILEFDVYGADVDDDDLVFRVVIDGVESNLLTQVGNNQAHFRWLPTAQDVGAHTADFFLTDGEEEVSERISITVLDREGGGDGPVFVSPDRYLLDLTQSASIEFTIEVKQDSTTDVTIELVRSIEGARFHGNPAEVGATAYGKKANVFWAPSIAQQSQGQHFLEVRAYDGAGHEATQSIAIVLRGIDGSCPGSAPTIVHTPLGDGPARGGFPISAIINDPESDILEATIWYSLVPNPIEADFRFVAMAPVGEEWQGLIPDPELEAGAIATVSYYLCARDDDDDTTDGDPAAGDRCDRLACTEPSRFVAFGPTGGPCVACAGPQDCPAGTTCRDEGDGDVCVPEGDTCRGGAGLGFCETCATAADCGGPADYCVSNGETGESFCALDCSQGQDCGVGNLCVDLGGGVLQCVPESFTCQTTVGAGLCEPCATRADCGGPTDNCLQAADGTLFCGQDCSGGASCPQGYTCADLTALEAGLFQCIPASGTCGAGPGIRPPRGGDLVINEVLADPPAASDPNGDGTASTTNDEFVELLNLSNEELDLTGVTVDDAAADQTPRFTFPAGSTIGPGRAVVIFGGGDPATFGPLGGAVVFVARGGGLGLNNGGDSVTVRDVAGNLLAQETFGAEGGQDVALARVPDGAGGGLAMHPAPGFSPGAQTCGNAFPIAQNPCGGASPGCNLDTEPNDTIANAVCLGALPAEVSGHVEHVALSDPPGPDAVDLFSLALQAGQVVRIRTLAGQVPEVGDTVLVLRDAGGAVLAENDDADFTANNLYSELLYTATAAGTIFVEVQPWRSTSRATAGNYVLRVEQQ